MLCLNKTFFIGILLVRTQKVTDMYILLKEGFFYTWLVEYYKLKLEYISKFKVLIIIIMNWFLEQTCFLKQNKKMTVKIQHINKCDLF